MKRATIDDMELGNLMFGNSRGVYMVEPRNDYQDAFQEFLEANNFDSYGHHANHEGRVFENDTFIIRPYYWGEDPDEMDKPNFKYKPTAFELCWYKYPMRDAYCNQDIDIETFKEMLDACAASMEWRDRIERRK